MLIVEDLLLCLTGDDTGRLLVSGPEADVGLGGALLVELALRERVTVTPGRAGRLTVLDAGPTGEPLLDDALATLTAKEGRRPQSAVTALGRGTRERVYARLVEAGILDADERRLLGLFPSRSWPTAQPAHEESVRARLAQALGTGTTDDPRLAALVSLLLAVGALHKVLSPESLGLTRRELTARGRGIAEGEWAGRAVREAIAGANAAIMTALGVAVASAGSGSGS